jgi:3'(2'),5'-bisphosphate nucleotidase
VIAEEAVAAGRIPPFERAAFLVDALDGTKEYLMGSDDFTVNIALVEDGDPTFGMLLAPASGRLFVTLGAKEAAGGLVRPDQLMAEFRPILSRIATVEPAPRALRVLSSRSHRSPETERFLARFAVSQDVRIGSSLKFGLMAAGEADIYPRFGPTSAWDIAAGHAVLAAAGGAVTTPDGKAMRYLEKVNLSRPEPFLNSSFIAWGRPSLVRAVG